VVGALVEQERGVAEHAHVLEAAQDAAQINFREPPLALPFCAGAGPESRFVPSMVLLASVSAVHKTPGRFEEEGLLILPGAYGEEGWVPIGGEFGQGRDTPATSLPRLPSGVPGGSGRRGPTDARRQIRLQKKALPICPPAGYLSARRHSGFSIA
jgi:hypothetical protein